MSYYSSNGGGEDYYYDDEGDPSKWLTDSYEDDYPHLTEEIERLYGGDLDFSIGEIKSFLPVVWIPEDA